MRRRSLQSFSEYQTLERDYSGPSCDQDDEERGPVGVRAPPRFGIDEELDDFRIARRPSAERRVKNPSPTAAAYVTTAMELVLPPLLLEVVSADRHRGSAIKPAPDHGAGGTEAEQAGHGRHGVLRSGPACMIY